MKAFSKQAKWICASLLGISMGLAGCNLFNPTGDVDIDSGDSKALTYEGYLKIQNSEFSEAKKLFAKAIKADSSNSEAWFGMAKSVMNAEDGMNTFRLIKMASEIKDLKDKEAKKLEANIDSVLYYLDKLIELESADKTDKKIKLTTFASDYLVLQITKAAIQLKKAAAEVNSLFEVTSDGMALDLNEFSIDSLGKEFRPVISTLDLAAQAMLEDPNATSAIIKAYIPDSTSAYFDDEQYSDLVAYAATTISDISDRVDSLEDNRLGVFFNFANKIDDDGDGCVDEEILDGFDNDGDGEIDEDLRDTRAIVQETDPNSDISVGTVKSLNILGSYGDVDIDMNGKKYLEDTDEWEFYIPDAKERTEKENHLLKFAIDLKFPGKNLNEKIKNKELIRQDTDVNNIKYSLEKRKKMVGGCWVNYTQEDFLKWFEGRKTK